MRAAVQVAASARARFPAQCGIRAARLPDHVRRDLSGQLCNRGPAASGANWRRCRHLAAEGCRRDVAGEPISRRHRVARQKMDELEQTITLERAGQHEQALALVRSGRGQHSMNAIRADMATSAGERGGPARAEAPRTGCAAILADAGRAGRDGRRLRARRRADPQLRRPIARAGTARGHAAPAGGRAGTAGRAAHAVRWPRPICVSTPPCARPG